MQTHMIPTLPSCYLGPPNHPSAQRIPFLLTQKLCRTMKFGGRRQIARILKSKCWSSRFPDEAKYQTSMDFNGEMTHDQDSAGQWQHVDGQDQSALLISSELAPPSPSLCDSLPTFHGHGRGC